MRRGREKTFIRSQTRAKSRRFNPSVFQRPQAAEKQREVFSLLDAKEPYLERRKKADLLHQQNTRCALANSLLTVFALICAFTDNELWYYHKVSSLQSDSLRVLIIAASVAQLFLTVQGAQGQLSMLKLLGLKHPHSTPYPASLFGEKARLWLLLCELSHLCIVMPPEFNLAARVRSEISTSTLSMQDFVTLSIVLRLHHVVKFVYSQSPMFLPRAQFYT